jgi:hypothetical protein
LEIEAQKARAASGHEKREVNRLRKLSSGTIFEEKGGYWGGTSSAGEVTGTQEWRVSPEIMLARCTPTSGVFAPFFPRSQITTYLAACMHAKHFARLEDLHHHHN